MKKLAKKIKLLGIDYDARIFNALRLLFALILLLYFVFRFEMGYIIGPIVASLFFVLCEYIVIDLPLRKKNVEIEKEGISFVSALLLNLEGGKSIKVSIKNSSRVIHGDVSNKFNKVLNDIKLGFTMEESLKDLSERLPSVYLQNIVLILIENAKYGTKILDSIEWQLEAMEEHYDNIVIGHKKILPIKLCLNTLLFLGFMIGILLYYTK